MARVPYLTREDLQPEDREIFDGVLAERGTVMNLFRVLAHTPNLLRGLLAYSSQIRFHLTLDPHLRELAILTVGRLCRATYEVSHHWNIARSAGVPREKLDALLEYERSSVFTERERAVIRYSVEATRDVQVSDATFAALRAFLDAPRIVELVQLVAYYNMISRILEPLGVELEAGFAKLP
jgi:uncharacterized peroxidase-related enzyme